MQTKMIEVYALSELSEEAQQEAHYKWLSNQDYPFAEENKNSLYKFAEIAEIKIKDFEYGGNSPAYCNWIANFNNYRYEDEILNLSGTRLIAWLYNNILNHIGKGKYYSTSGHYDASGKYHYKYRHSKCTKEYDNCPISGMSIDNALIQPILDYVRKAGQYKEQRLKFWQSVTLEDIFNECCSNWAKDCNADAEYQSSFEAFQECCEANQYTFTASGRMENI